MRRNQQREVVYVERGGDSSAKWLFWGALLGAGVALLYAPSTGEETRRNLQRKLWKFRAMTEEKLDEITQQFGGAKDSLEGVMDGTVSCQGSVDQTEVDATGTWCATVIESLNTPSGARVGRLRRVPSCG